MDSRAKYDALKANKAAAKSVGQAELSETLVVIGEYARIMAMGAMSMEVANMPNARSVNG